MIRDGREDDLPAIVAIYNDAIPGRLATADLEPVSVESRRSWLVDRDDRHPIWVFERARAVVGWMTLGKFYGRPAYAATVEVSVYVAPGARGVGIATELMNHAFARAPSLGISTFLGFVFAHNRPSVALCEKFGFAHWGHLPRVAVLDGVERDLLILGKRLDDPRGVSPTSSS
jgi:phosphinothricin acetyltransferase